MGYNTKNYTEQGGQRTVIEGELVFGNKGRLVFYGKELKPLAFQALSNASTLEELVLDFNALISKLKASGLMEEE